MKFKEDDKVKIIGNISNHDFPIGEIVTIKEIHFDDCFNYLAVSEQGDYRLVLDEDIESINRRFDDAAAVGGSSIFSHSWYWSY